MKIRYEIPILEVSRNPFCHRGNNTKLDGPADSPR